MSTICCKDLTIRVRSGPPASARFVYWTMEETGFADRVDMVSSIHLTPRAECTGPSNAFVSGGLGIAAQPALYGNGFRIAKGLPNQYILTGTYTTEAFLGMLSFNALMYHGGIGFSFCFWLKVNLLNTINASISYGRTPYILSSVIFNSASCIARLRDTNTHTEDVAIPIPTAGVWTFYELFYDSSLAKMGCRINNTTDYFASFVPVFSPSPNGSFGIAQNGFPFSVFTNPPHDATDVQDFTTDEVLIRMDARLTVAQRAYLYNGGAGRTWPIVLP